MISCIHCKQAVSEENGLFMEKGFVCTDCLYKTSKVIEPGVFIDNGLICIENLYETALEHYDLESKPTTPTPETKTTVIDTPTPIAIPTLAPYLLNRPKSITYKNYTHLKGATPIVIGIIILSILTYCGCIIFTNWG